MTYLSGDWLNRIGMVLGFLSFWFAGPELVGESRLKSWGLATAKTIRGINVALAALAVCGSTIGVIAIRVLSHIEPTELNDVRGRQHFWLVVIATSLLLAFAQPPIRWFIRFHADDSAARQRLLFIAAGLFTASFILQFAATYVKG